MIYTIRLTLPATDQQRAGWVRFLREFAQLLDDRRDEVDLADSDLVFDGGGL